MTFSEKITLIKKSVIRGEYWIVCGVCGKPQKSSVQIGHKTKCDDCGKEFRVYQKFFRLEDIEDDQTQI
jgi:hypothetical protein